MKRSLTLLVPVLALFFASAVVPDSRAQRPPILKRFVITVTAKKYEFDPRRSG
jgi:hypothetical protein